MLIFVFPHLFVFWLLVYIVYTLFFLIRLLLPINIYIYICCKLLFFLVIYFNSLLYYRCIILHVTVTLLSMCWLVDLT